MANFEERMRNAVRDVEIPGAVLVAESVDGKLRYAKAFGNRSLKDLKPDPIQVDATMWLASCSKLPTCIAALQCVEKGIFTLDEDVTRILPELKNIQILKGFETGPDGKDKPILVENTKTITLRHLLTHSSGLSYDFFNPVLARFRAAQGYTPSLFIKGPVISAFSFPLLFAPGEAWDYGVGIDWAGWMVERVNGNMSLEDYMQKYIWGPLGVKSISFYPKKHPAIMSKMTDMTDRTGGITMFGTAADPSGRLEYTDNTIWNNETDGISGGASGYGAPLDYQKLLHSILTNDEILLQKDTVEEMFKPQLSAAAQKSFMEKLSIPEANQGLGGLPLGTKVNYGLGGELLMEDLPGRQKKGTMQWGGYPNLYWWIDRVGGLAGIYGSQVNPPGDLKSIELTAEWQKHLYSSYCKEKL